MESRLVSDWTNQHRFTMRIPGNLHPLKLTGVMTAQMTFDAYLVYVRVGMVHHATVCHDHISSKHPVHPAPTSAAYGLVPDVRKRYNGTT
jgi:hypothetical protein